ncbi:PREDICTED: uncharacterized protein LOC106741340 isoform X3 [Dinoponera quadriceps]|uniref:Uncharacterized protein LOC106741340 isoform X3 n=1 Tax=Dinoponera quadriceps TaxID=609295 RepID=A0A6P3WS94_DINQU|nr:PREDICTED: uncharacterized protein LOC106741340 isoform X3 [Dinoponera quadriceps]
MSSTCHQQVINYADEGTLERLLTEEKAGGDVLVQISWWRPRETTDRLATATFATARCWMLNDACNEIYREARRSNEDRTRAHHHARVRRCCRNS